MFRRLVSIYQLGNFCAYAGDSLKTNASNFKSCKDSCEAFASFSDNDVKRAFDEDVRSPNSTALAMMSRFVHDCIDCGKYIQLVRCLLDMIRSDARNLDETVFFVYEELEPATGKELCAMDTFTIELFLLGVWHFIIMHRSGSNEKGAPTYRQWYPDGRVYRGKIGNGITREIHVKSSPAEYPEHSEGNDFNKATQAEEIPHFDEDDPKEDSINIPEGTSEDTKTVNQTIEHATIVNQYGGKNIHIDHVGTLNL